MSKGFNYYKADTDRFQDIKIKRLKKQFGCAGYCVYQYCLNEIYRVEGAYIQWTSDHVFDCSDYWDLDENTVNEIVSYCIDIRLFDETAFKTRSILTSKSVQSRYIDMCKVSKKKAYIPLEIILIEPEQTTEPQAMPLFNSGNIQENSANTPETSGNIPEKIDKEKKRKEKERKAPSIPQLNTEEAKLLVSAMLLKNTPTIAHRPEDVSKPRNTQLLLETLQRYNLTPAEIEEVLGRTDYGVIGHPVWSIIHEISGSTKIKMPRLFLLSRLRNLDTSKSAAS